MRTAVDIICPFGRDVAWITQAIVEQYAGACLRGKRQSEREGIIICGHNFERFEILRSFLNDTNPQFIELMDELLAEYGIDHFMRSKPRLEHIRDIEELMEQAASTGKMKEYAELLKQLRGLRGWEEKPRDPVAPSTTVNVYGGSQPAAVLDKHNPREVERFYQSLMG